MEILEREEDVTVAYGSPLSCIVSPFLIINGIPKKHSSYYNKLPEEPLYLTVLKLDGSSFDITVPRNGRVAELKQAVEAAFSHLPKSGPGMVSWPHVWGHFCLSYDGQKLLTDRDLLGTYRIKDGDKLNFVRHVSISYNLFKMRSEKEDSNMNKSSISKSCGGRQRRGAQVNRHQNDLANHQKDIQDNSRGVVANCDSRLVHLFKGFSYKLASPERRIKQNSSTSKPHYDFLLGRKSVARSNSD